MRYCWQMTKMLAEEVSLEGGKQDMASFWVSAYPIKLFDVHHKYSSFHINTPTPVY